MTCCNLQVALDEAKIMGLDDALEYITDDEQVEVTPQSIRIRKVRTTAAAVLQQQQQLLCMYGAGAAWQDVGAVLCLS